MPRGRAPAEVEIDFQKRKEKRKEQGRARELPGFDPRSPVEILAETEEEEEGTDAGEGAGQPCGDEHRRRRAVVQRQCMTPLGAAAWVYDVYVCHVHVEYIYQSVTPLGAAAYVYMYIIYISTIFHTHAHTYIHT